MRRIVGTVLLCGWGLGCSATEGKGLGDKDAGGVVGTPHQPGLQYDGSIVWERTPTMVMRSAGRTERIQVSAPIFPNVLVMYEGQGMNYPTTPEGRADLAHRSSLTFEFLMAECPAKYPEIQVRAEDDPPLDAEQLRTNYEAIGRCAYDQYTAKPYWIPQLIDDVDLCGQELGPAFRLITEEDLLGFSEEDRALLQNVLSTPLGGGVFIEEFYFSLDVYARATDGTIVLGRLGLGGGPVSPLPPTVDGQPTSHLEAGLSLRCIHREVLPED
jgi:hypothetical protein